MLNYLLRVGDALSQLLNVVFLWSLNPNESISGRAYRLQKVRGWCYLRTTIDLCLSPWETDHCEKSFDADVQRAKDLLTSAENADL